MSAPDASRLTVVAELGEAIRTRQTPTIAQVFGHGHRVPEPDLERDLGPVGPLISAGLLRRVGAGRVESALSFGAYRGLLLASDRRDRPYTADHVLGITWATEVATSLTPREAVGRALDIGSGNGVHALGMSAHATAVVAVDLSRRAVAATRLNAALNGITNVEAVHGDLLEPVDGERFDLIVANPPYVISPELRYLYRDSGLEDDEMSRRCVIGAGRALAEGGVAIVLVEWLDGPSRTWDRPKEWVDEAGCAGWVMSYRTMTVNDYIDMWVSVPLRRPDEAVVRERWLEWFQRSGATSVTSGVVILSRRDVSDPFVHATDFVPKPGGDAGAQVLRGLAWQHAVRRGTWETSRRGLRLAADVIVGGSRLETPLGAIALSSADTDLLDAARSRRGLRRVLGGRSKPGAEVRLLRLVRAGVFEANTVE